MTELKTQKDFREDSERSIESFDRERQEAIRWIQKLNNHESLGLEEYQKYCGCDEGCCSPDGAVNWIKHFFNITEDDLI